MRVNSWTHNYLWNDSITMALSNIDSACARSLALALLLSALVGCGGTSSGGPSVGGAVIPNLSDTKAAITQYHDSGQWAQEKGAVMQRADDWIVFRGKQGGKLAVVLDIDETSLDNWPCMHGMDYGMVLSVLTTWVVGESAEANPAVLHFFQLAKANGIAAFFVTGRHENLRTFTGENLDKAGYAGYDELVMCPADYTDPSLVPYKSGARATIEQQGYTIIANVGDQQSDLKGGHAEKQFKLPNPMYTNE